MRRPSMPREDIRDNVKQFGKIPEQTCPLIDDVLEILGKHECDTPSDGVKVKKLMEKLRTDNGQLRGLGHDWYKTAEDYYALIQEMDYYIDELENQIYKKDQQILELEKQI